MSISWTSLRSLDVSNGLSTQGFSTRSRNDAALAGLTSRPVIAVPTSVGYGAAFEGLAALLAMLSSCAPGITVVNIDNGFGAALAAHRILRVAARARER